MPQREVLGLIADAVAAAGVRQVFGFGLDGERALPTVLPPGGVSALVLPGATRDWSGPLGAVRHTYEVEVRLMVPLGEVGVVSAAVLPLPDEIADAVLARTASASRTYDVLRVAGVSAPSVQTYAGGEFLTLTISLEVSESRRAIPGVGP